MSGKTETETKPCFSQKKLKKTEIWQTYQHYKCVCMAVMGNCEVLVGKWLIKDVTVTVKVSEENRCNLLELVRKVPVRITIFMTDHPVFYN